MTQEELVAMTITICLIVIGIALLTAAGSDDGE